MSSYSVRITNSFYFANAIKQFSFLQEKLEVKVLSFIVDVCKETDGSCLSNYLKWQECTYWQFWNFVHIRWKEWLHQYCFEEWHNPGHCKPWWGWDQSGRGSKWVPLWWQPVAPPVVNQVIKEGNPGLVFACFLIREASITDHAAVVLFIYMSVLWFLY